MGGFWHGRESTTRGHCERDGSSEMKRKTWGRARKKQTPNSLFSLSNLNCREGEDGGMGGGGGREKNEEEPETA